MAQQTRRWQAWLELWRPQELLTVPGATLAGIALAGGLRAADWRVWAVVAAGVLCLGGGFLLNDWFDRHIDHNLHPSRPLPSGRISHRAAMIACIFAFTAALVLAGAARLEAFVVAFTLVLLTVSYQGFGRHIPVLGTLFRSTCQALYLLLGTAIVNLQISQAQVAAAACFYVAGTIGWMAPRRQPKPTSRLAVVCFCLSPLPIIFTGLNTLTGAGCSGVWIALAVFVANTLYIAIVLWLLREPHKLSPLTPWLYRHLIFVQAFWVAVGTRSNCYWVAGVMLLWPISWRLSRVLGKQEW